MIYANQENQMNGLDLMAELPDKSVALAFFDPQYRGLLDKMKYGHGGDRNKARVALPQMTTADVHAFMAGISRVLMPGGHLLFWLDKFSVMEQLLEFTDRTPELERVDMVTWNKMRFGMGARTRRVSEYMVILQKRPKGAKRWKANRSIPDVWSEGITNSRHTHQKPYGLLKTMISLLTVEGETVLDPCAGSYEVLRACDGVGGRTFYGADLELLKKPFKRRMFSDADLGDDAPKSVIARQSTYAGEMVGSTIVLDSFVEGLMVDHLNALDYGGVEDLARMP